MKFEAKNLSPVAYHAITCVKSVCRFPIFDLGKMAPEVLPVARISEYAGPCKPAIHV